MRLIVNANQRPCLRGQPVVRCRDKPISIGQRSGYYYVELKLARRHQAGKLHRRGDATDGEGRQRRERTGLCLRTTYHGRRRWSEAIGIEHHRLAWLGGSGETGVQARGPDKAEVGGVLRHYVRSTVDHEERRGSRLRFRGECRANNSLYRDHHLRRSWPDIDRKSVV